MNLLIKQASSFKIVVIDGRLDTTTYTELEKMLNTLFDQGDRQIILDCTTMDYVSSSGLRVFLMILKKIKSAGGKLILYGLQPAIHNIFEISGFLSIFNFVETIDQAIDQDK